MRMRVVVGEREVFEGEGIDIGHCWIEGHRWQGTRFASELQLSLFQVIGIEMEIAKSMDKFTRLVAADLSHHLGQEGVGSDVERNAEEKVRGPLIELAGEAGLFAADIMHIELEKEVARRERHFVNETHVPRRNQVSARVRVVFELINEAGYLVDSGAVGLWPRAPLLAINGTEVAVFVGPFVPDFDAVFFEIGDVGIPFKEPEKLMNDGAEVKFLGGDAGEALPQVVAGLMAKNRECSRAGAVGAGFAVVENVLQKIEVGAHGETRGRLEIEARESRRLSCILLGWTPCQLSPTVLPTRVSSSNEKSPESPRIMEELENKKPKKNLITLLTEIGVLLCVVLVSGALGWFIGRGEVKNLRAVTHQLEQERRTAADLRKERAELREDIKVLKTGGVEKKETDVDRLIARKEQEWNRRLNQVRIEAEVEKVKRVEELEREVRLLKMDERAKEEMAQGDDSEVPDGLAQGLTPRARQVCAEMLDWEGLDPEALKAAKEKLTKELGARSLGRVKFGSGSAHVGNDDLDALKIAVADTSDYALLLAVGFADTGGDEELNRELGSLRARNAADSLQGLIRRGQLVESVYLGETSRFGAKAENRVVEVWELQR